MKVFQCILKSIETILIQNYFYSNAKKYKQDKKKKKKKGQILFLKKILTFKNIKLF